MASFGILKFRFGLEARVSLYDKVAAFLEANIDVVSTLKSIRNRYAKQKDFRAEIIDDWLKVMSRGGKFGDAIQKWVPPAEHMLISAGERGQGLIHGLHEAVVLSTASASNIAAIKGGVIMPIVLLSLIIGMLIGFQVQMVPVFSNLMPINHWPEGAQTLESMSRFFYNFWWAIILLVVAMSFVVGSTIGKWVGPMREIADRFPPWSIYKSYQGSSFLIGLASLMKAGIANFDALRTMRATASPWMQVHLSKMMQAMKTGGGTPGEALDTGLLDNETAGDVQDYSRLGSFHDAIYLLGARSLVESVKKITVKMSILKNVLLVVVAVCIMWIYGTSYNLQTTIAESMQQSTGK